MRPPIHRQKEESMTSWFLTVLKLYMWYVITSLLVSVAVLGTVAYVAVHFLLKWW